jgi:hypothetical protein
MPRIRRPRRNQISNEELKGDNVRYQTINYESRVDNLNTNDEIEAMVPPIQAQEEI